MVDDTSIDLHRRLITASAKGSPMAGYTMRTVMDIFIKAVNDEMIRALFEGYIDVLIKHGEDGNDRTRRDVERIVQMCEQEAGIG